MSGLVDRFELITDTHEALVCAVKILLGWHSSVSHFRTGKDVDGHPYLILMWAEGDQPYRGQPLLAKMKDPSAITDQLFAWLKEQEYGRQPDHDGSNGKGFYVSITGPIIERKPNKYYNKDDGWSKPMNDTYDTSFYDVLCIRPWWVEYHK